MIDFIHPSIKAHEHQVKLVNQINNGIDSAKELIYKKTHEYNEVFEQRIKNSILVNFVKKIVQIQNGLINRKDPVYKGFSASQEKDFENISGNNNLIQFISDFTKSVALNSKAYILVDIPEDSKTPELNIIERSRLINYKKNSNGVFTLAVIIEAYSEYIDEFSFETKMQYRVIDETGNVRIYRDEKLYETIITSYNFCPFFEADVSDVPILYDIAKINALHLIFNSNQNDYVLESLDPFLFGKALGVGSNQTLDGEDETPKPVITAGVRNMSTSENESSDIKWIELNSSGNYEISSKHILKLEDEIANGAIKLVSNDGTSNSATEANFDNVEKGSLLVQIVLEVENAINDSLNAYFLMKNNTKSNGIVSINRDFTIQEVSDAFITGLNSLQVAGNLSKETLIKTLQDKEVIDIISVDDELKKISKESVEYAESMTVDSPDVRA